MESTLSKIKAKLKQYSYVLKVTKKPSMKEYKMIVKISGIGLVIIGVIGFVIHMLVQALKLI